MLHLDLHDWLLPAVQEEEQQAAAATAAGPQGQGQQLRQEVDEALLWEASCEAAEWLDQLVKGLLADAGVRAHVCVGWGGRPAPAPASAPALPSCCSAPTVPAPMAHTLHPPSPGIRHDHSSHAASPHAGCWQVCHLLLPCLPPPFVTCRCA